MHDLNMINRLNCEAFGPAIINLRRQGRYVMVVYAGLHIISIESFSCAETAAAGVAERTEIIEASERIEVLAPFVPPPVGASPSDGVAEAPLMRDQSEDRTRGFATLEDYLKHVAPPGAFIVAVSVNDSMPA